MFKYITDRRRGFVFGAIFFMLFISGWLLFFRKKTSSLKYQTAKVERGTIVSTVSVSGTVLSTQTTAISTQASGTVKRVYVQEGKAVKKGEVVAEIDLDLSGQQRHSAALANYLAAKNSLDSAQASLYSLQADMFAKWDTYMSLAQSSTYQNSDGSPNEVNRALPEFHVAKNNWLAAEAKYKNQQAAIAQAQAALDNSWLAYQMAAPRITAPQSGTVTNLMVVEGMMVNVDQSTTTNNNNATRVAVIKGEGAPLATFNLSEVDVGRVLPGQKATITVDSLPDKTFTGRVVIVDRMGMVTSSVTNYPVVIRFDEQSAEILPNMAAVANIILASKQNVLFAPAAAIINQEGGSYLRMLKNGQEELVPVEIGLTSDTGVEIVSGATEGEEVIIGSITESTSNLGRSSPFSGQFGGRSGGAFMRFAR